MPYKLLTADNPLGWVFAEYAPGKRVTKDMIHFDTNREDVKINMHGVVLFYDVRIANFLLNLPSSNIGNVD